MAINFDVEKIKQLVEAARTGQNRQPLGEARYAFPEQGIHSMQFFIDPESEILRRVVVHAKKSDRVLCPKVLDETQRCLICDAATETKNWRYRARTQALVHARLLETTAPTDYWQEGKSYALVGNNLFYRAFIKFLENIEAEGWRTFLDPTVRSPYVQMRISKSSVNISPLDIVTDKPVFAGDKPPESWQPLNTLWVKSSFDRSDYRMLLKSVLRDCGKIISPALLAQTNNEIAENESIEQQNT